nr:MAG TPA: hypothetical protein [Caudoviricetes sp.]
MFRFCLNFHKYDAPNLKTQRESHDEKNATHFHTGAAYLWMCSTDVYS